MIDLKQVFAQRIATGLQRQSITKPSEWACAYRIMGGKSFPGNWGFKYHPWLKELHDSETQFNVGMKAAQMGYTETMLNLVFYYMDVHATDCLYVLPSKTPDASDFSSARFDSAVELSSHIENMFSDVKNVGHKRAGSANLYIRGSQSKSGLRSIPVGVLIIDEVSIMNQENIALAIERTSGQLEKVIWQISTPTIEGENIDKEYSKSTKEHFFFRCPRCGQLEELTFPDSLKIIGDDVTDPRLYESHLICKKTKLELPFIVSDDVRTNADAKAEWIGNNLWVAEHTDREMRGFQVPQLYSCTMPPGDIALAYLKGLTDPADEQEFYNSKLGVTHAVAGARILDDDINRCKGNYKNIGPVPKGILTMGIDVGNICHYVIDEWYFPQGFTILYPEQAKCKTVRFGTVETFNELDKLMRKFRIQHCVIDSQPERRAAHAFANRHMGRVNLCFYAKGITGKTISVPKDSVDHLITVDRTSWLDLSLTRFQKDTIRIPYDIDQEFRDHIKAPTRVYSKDANGNSVGTYESGSKPDHYAHARNYSEIAMSFVATGRSSQDIGKVL